MKNIFAVILILCAARVASAQVTPTATQKALDAIRIRNAKIDTASISRVMATRLTPGNLFGQALATALTHPNFVGNATVVYSTMPVARIPANNIGGVALIAGKNYTMPVKRILLAEPRR